MVKPVADIRSVLVCCMTNTDDALAVFDAGVMDSEECSAEITKQTIGQGSSTTVVDQYHRKRLGLWLVLDHFRIWTNAIEHLHGSFCGLIVFRFRRIVVRRWCLWTTDQSVLGIGRRIGLWVYRVENCSNARAGMKEEFVGDLFLRDESFQFKADFDGSEGVQAEIRELRRRGVNIIYYK